MHRQLVLALQGVQLRSFKSLTLSVTVFGPLTLVFLDPQLQRPRTAQRDLELSVLLPLVTLTLVIEGATTVICSVTVAVEPEASVTVKATENFPVFVNVWLVATPVAVPPSPKLQPYPVSVDPVSVD